MNVPLATVHHLYIVVLFHMDNIILKLRFLGLIVHRKHLAPEPDVYNSDGFSLEFVGENLKMCKTGDNVVYHIITVVRLQSD